MIAGRGGGGVGGGEYEVAQYDYGHGGGGGGVGGGEYEVAQYDYGHGGGGPVPAHEQYRRFEVPANTEYQSVAAPVLRSVSLKPKT
jgi:hypothetical protein